MEGDRQREMGFGMGAEGGSNAVEFFVKGVEEVGEIESGELGGEALQGLLLARFGLGTAETAAMMAGRRDRF